MSGSLELKKAALIKKYGDEVLYRILTEADITLSQAYTASERIPSSMSEDEIVEHFSGTKKSPKSPKGTSFNKLKLKDDLPALARGMINDPSLQRDTRSRLASLGPKTSKKEYIKVFEDIAQQYRMTPEEMIQKYNSVYTPDQSPILSSKPKVLPARSPRAVTPIELPRSNTSRSPSLLKPIPARSPTRINLPTRSPIPSPSRRDLKDDSLEEDDIRTESGNYNKVPPRVSSPTLPRARIPPRTTPMPILNDDSEEEGLSAFSNVVPCPEGCPSVHVPKTRTVSPLTVKNSYGRRTSSYGRRSYNHYF